MTKQIRFVFFAVVLVLAAPAAYAKDMVPSAGVYLSAREHAEKEIRRAFDQWMAAVSTGSSDAVIKLYAADAVLLPTLSSKICNTPELRKEYFDDFTAKQGLKGVIGESHIQIFGNTAVNSGLYTFSYTKDNAIVEMPARFTFVYHKYPQGWMIVDHHSSKLPAP